MVSWKGFSIASWKCQELSYQDTVDHLGSLEVKTSERLLGLRKLKKPTFQRWTQTEKHCFKLFGFDMFWVFGILVLDDPNFGGLRFPWTVPGDKSHGIPWRSIPKLWIPGPSAYRSPGTSSHTYPGEMKMNDEKTVLNENVFQTRFLVCCFQLKLEMWNVIDSCSMLRYLSRTVQHVVMWKHGYWFCSVAIAQ